MSHGITEKDNLFVAFTPAWHGLGTVVDKALSSEDALRIAKLDWNVEQFPVFVDNKKVENSFGNVRSDTGDCLGIVSKKYVPMQNRDAFAFVDDLMGLDEAVVKYESAGSLWGGERIWMMARIPDSKILDDTIANYLFISNSHGGKSSVKCGISNVRIVCNNTLQLATESAPRVWSARHMSSIEERKKEAMQALGFSSSYIKQMEDRANKLYSIKVEPNYILDKLFVLKEDVSERIKRNILETREEILSIHNNKNDLGNFRNTGWGVYNAVADYVSNSEPLRKTDTFETKRFVSYMDGNDLLSKAQQLIEEVA
jgi:phage/plasmid-like protein (TIGR03299 family)